ncbi:MAG: 50S ribosomal protein L29 [Thermoplasmata archaeon]|nr:50S ribosomal protein L29 [Thermoplasmata archaeon]
MTTIKPAEIRAMGPEKARAKLEELRVELMHERGVAAMGGAPPNTGKIRALRKQVARIMTMLNEEKKRGEH